MRQRAELHLHLEGAIDRETLREIDPSVTSEEIDTALNYSDFDGFINAYVFVGRRLKDPGSYAIAARRLFERLAAQGIVYAEVTLSAGMIPWKKLDLDAVFDALANESAKSPVPVRWILDAVRQWGPEAAAPIFDFAASRQGDGVVAIGLGGYEEKGPALLFRELYEKARERGLRLTCHAGETTGPQSVWEALEIGSQRIGHGIRAVEDPRLMAHLRDRDIPLEICITSNLRTGAVASIEEHPVRKLFDASVPIILNTDDPDLFGCSLESEYRLAGERFEFSERELDQLAGNSLTYAFDRQAAKNDGLPPH